MKNNRGKSDLTEYCHHRKCLSHLASVPGKICFTNFLHVIHLKLREKDCQEEITKAFKLFDKEGKGSITYENLRQVADELGDPVNNEEVHVSLKSPSPACFISSFRNLHDTL